MRVRSLRSFSDTQQDESLPWLHETPSQNKQKKRKKGWREGGRERRGRKEIKDGGALRTYKMPSIQMSWNKWGYLSNYTD